MSVKTYRVNRAYTGILIHRNTCTYWNKGSANLTLTHDFDLSTLTLKTCGVHSLNTDIMCAKLDQIHSNLQFGLYHIHKIISVLVHCDLNL